MDPARIRAVSPAPAYCSGCFGAKPLMRHVDFGAAWDGPMLPLPADANVVGVVGHSIDDLVLCEECIATAAKILGLEDVALVRAERDQLETANDELHGRLRILEERCRQLEGLRANDDRLAAAFRPPGRPRPGTRRPTPA
jgi:Asp-tRNA(Asn)/Glu-tRNA(Gln) amidotransferase A subunit family amidase